MVSYAIIVCYYYLGPSWFPQKHAAMRTTKEQFLHWNRKVANGIYLGNEVTLIIISCYILHNVLHNKI